MVLTQILYDEGYTATVTGGRSVEISEMTDTKNVDDFVKSLLK